MTTVEHAARVTAEPNRAMITLVAMAATVMQVLDTTIANVALPHMQGSLGATQDQISWILTSYIVVSAIATPLTGWVASRLGRTRAFVIATAGFTITSIFCGLATTLPQIVLFRVLQGAMGAILVPMSQSILLDAYPRSETAKAMSIFSTGVMVGPILGPIVGGYLTEAFSWRWCFYINVPIGLFSIIGAMIFVPETLRMPGRKLDWLGFSFLSLAIAGLQLVLDRGEHKGWFQSGEIITEAALMVFGLYMFIVHSATTAKPFIDMRLLRDRTFVSGVAIMALIFMVYLGALVLVPPGAEKQTFEPIDIKSECLQHARDAMNDVCNTPGGTAYGKRIMEPRFAMGGKTGTSQVRKIITRGVKQDTIPWEYRHHALFIGFAPVDAPKYACCIAIEHGGGGAATAAPVARDVLLKIQQLDESDRNPKS